MAPQFLDVGEAGFSLDSFTPTGTELSDNISIMQIDEFGGEVATYVWIEWGGDNGDEKCWSLDGAGEKAEGISFGPGDAFWVQGSSDSQYLQSAGEVSTSDATIRLQNGATLIGNAFPTPVSLQDILPTGTELSDNVSIMQIDEFGGEVATYVWIEWGGDNGDEKCWSLDGAGEKTEGVTFAPGEGLWVQGSSTSQYLTIPAPTL